MNRSEQINELAAALAKAQGEMEGAAKSAANPFFKSRYADLAAVFDAIREPFAKNGLAVMQFPRTNLEGMCVEVETLLAHSSGQWVSETIAIPLKEMTAQPIGSGTTYGKRYGLQAICGVPSEDDDGEAAVGRPQNGQQKAAAVAKNVIDQGAQQLRDCDSLSALEAAYKSFTPELRKALVGVKDEMKAKLTESAHAA